MIFGEPSKQFMLLHMYSVIVQSTLGAVHIIIICWGTYVIVNRTSFIACVVARTFHSVMIDLIFKRRVITSFFFLGESGPPHSREFTCSVTVRGWSFSGSGSTKKLAKAAAAESALQYLNNLVNVGPNATGVSIRTVKSRAEEIG